MNEQTLSKSSNVQNEKDTIKKKKKVEEMYFSALVCNF